MAKRGVKGGDGRRDEHWAGRDLALIGGGHSEVRPLTKRQFVAELLQADSSGKTSI